MLIISLILLFFLQSFELTQVRTISSPNRAIDDHVFTNIFICLKIRQKLGRRFHPEPDTCFIASVILKAEINFDKLKS